MAGRKIVGEYVVGGLGLGDVVWGVLVRIVVGGPVRRELGWIDAESVVVMQTEGDVLVKSQIVSLLVILGPLVRKERTTEDIL